VTCIGQIDVETLSNKELEIAESMADAADGGPDTEDFRAE